MKRDTSIFILGLLLGVLIAVIGFSFLSVEQNSGARVLRLAHSLPESSPGHRALVWMSEDLKQRSGETMEVIIFPSGQLGTETDTLEQMQRGALDMTRNSAGVVEGFIPEFSVFGTPYLFDDEIHYWNVLEGEIGQELLDLGVQHQLRGLGYYDSGARSFYTKSKAVDAPADLIGLKIRTQRSKTAMDLVDQLGASATPMPFGELYTGLQQGVVDGAENNPPSYYDTRHYEVAPFYTLDEHTRVPDVIMVSEATWMKLDAQERKWLRNSVQASMAVQRQYWKDYEQAVLGMLETEGVTIIQPDKKLFQVAAEPMWSQIQNVHVKELIRRIQSFPRGSVSSEL